MASASATTPPAPSSLPPGLVQARVTRVVDGDTIEVDRALDGKATIRFIGVDTPETVAPGRPVDCFGPEASANTKQLLDGQTVYLEKDVSETDRFQRLLRYVYLADGRMVNEVIVRDGYAQVATFPPDVKYQQRFLAGQTDARNANRGLWGNCGSVAPAAPTQAPVAFAPSPTPQPPQITGTPRPPVLAPATLAPQPTARPTENCDRQSYPDVCIPRYPPDLDCNQIPFKRFRVLQPDPHRFDADRDGIGCET